MARYTYDEILPLVEQHGIRRGRPPGQVWFLCPVHEDRDPSCTLSPRTGLVCQSRRCDPFEIARALGWEPRTNGHSDDPIPERHQTHKAPVARPPDAESGKNQPPPIWVQRLPDREFVYRDADGQPMAVHGRWNLPGGHKTFAWRLPTSPNEASWNSGYRHGIKDVLSEEDLPLYNLPELLAAPEGADVLICEGEKAVEAATMAGQLATTLGGGSGQRRIGKGVLDPLKRLHRVFWPDHSPDGWAYMNWLAQQTKNFPRAQHLLRIPDAEPKDDAYDWFVRRKQTVQELVACLAGITTRPTVEFLGTDGLKLFIPSTGGNIVQLEATSIEKTPKRELWAEISVTLDGPVAAQIDFPYEVRFNFLSHSSRSSLAKDLKDYFPEAIKDWAQTLNTATVLVRKNFTAKATGRDMADLPRSVTTRFHVRPLYPWRHHSIVFGIGQGSKSVTVQSQLICMALGYPWASVFDDMIPGPWGWLDYEDNDDGENFFYRGARICQGLYLPDVPRNLIHFYAAEGIPLVDLVPDLKAYTLEHGLVGWVVDSAMPACGGNPLDTPAVQQYFDACSKLRTSVVTLAHVVKSAVTGDSAAAKIAANLMPYGSAAWETRARRTWNVQYHQAEGASTATVKWFNRKKNAQGARPFGFKIDFHDPDGPITFEHDDAILTERQEDEDEGDGADRVENLLVRAIAPMTVDEIADAAGLSDKQVRRILRDDRFTTVKSGSKGNKALYTVAVTSPAEQLEALPF